MADPRRQFRVLYRDFLVRLVDLEVLSAAGDPTRLFVQFAALLGALSFVLAVFIVRQQVRSLLSPEQLALASWGDQEFLIGTTMAITGMFAIIAWNSVFPDRRDSLILGTLPLHTRTMFLAKVSALATGLGVSIAAVNIATGLSYPFVATPTDTGAIAVIRSFAAYWVTMLAAGAFVFSALLAVEGLAAQLLSYRLFLRVSSLLQMAAFFLVLAVYFLSPGPSQMSVTAPENRHILDWFPSFWFLGLFQQLNGPVHPVFGALATRALWSLGIAVAIAVSTYTLAYFRIIRRSIDEPDIVPSDRRHRAARWQTYLVSKLAPKPLERAIILFTARTLARSRQHRAILAAYLGIGLAISLAYSKTLLYGDSRMYAALRRYIHVPRWSEPNPSLMAAGFVMLVFAVIGARAVFALPGTLKANWIFRITAVHNARTYFIAVRKALYACVAIPIWITAAILYFIIWPAPPVAAHMLVVGLVGVILIERSLYEFRKIPFACSYLPGKSDLKRKLAVYGTLFLFLTDVGTRIEYWAMESRSRYLVIVAILVAIAVLSRKRWFRFAATPYHRLQFEELETAEVSPLDLRRDGAWGSERYIDAEPELEAPLRVRIRRGLFRAAIATSVALATGAAYEQYGQWQHRRHFPQIGQSVDIGGRSLNIFCSGGGGPAVVFESGSGGAGFGWTYIQREVAKFTRACWYDRAGYGWSDSGPYPRDSRAIATDLHKLLRAAAVPPPYVLVGASFGGLNVRVFNGLYPDEVAGMVLADSSHFDERDPLPPPGESEPSPSFLYAQSVFAQVLMQVGVSRVFMDADIGEPPKGLTPQEWIIARSFEPRTITENAKELFLESAKQARAASGLGDRPLIVLTAALPPEAGNLVQARQMLRRQNTWIEIQAQLARLSTRGKQVVLENSHHCIQCDAPEAIIAATREVVQIVGPTPASAPDPQVRLH